jgi:photosystem II stability/assembly factor-like uncharacterized protein
MAAQPSLADFQLVQPDQGWALVGDRLLWTDDGGQTWNDRTPQNIFSRWLGVHFLDGQKGWALVADSALDGGSAWHVLRTVDGGLSWQAYGMRVEPELAAMGEIAFFDFLDERQGWLSVRLHSGSAFSLGVLFSTQDGGQTWQQRAIPLGEAVRFIDPQTGWTAGGAAGQDLYVTRDGGITWNAAALVAVDSSPVFYSLPQFQDRLNGFIAITLADPGRPRIEIFRTQDAGQTWLLSAAIPLAPEGLPGAMAPVAVVDFGAQTVLAADLQADLLYAVDPTQARLAPQGAFRLPDGVVSLQFATPDQGWARVVQSACNGSKDPAANQPFTCQVEEALYQTRDGGRTWNPIR